MRTYRTRRRAHLHLLPLLIFHHDKDALQHDEKTEQCGQHDFIPPRRKRSVAPDIGFDRRFDEHAEKGSDNGADAAGEHRTADNRRCDGVAVNCTPCIPKLKPNLPAFTNGGKSSLTLEIGRAHV